MYCREPCLSSAPATSLPKTRSIQANDYRKLINDGLIGKRWLPCPHRVSFLMSQLLLPLLWQSQGFLVLQNSRSTAHTSYEIRMDPPYLPSPKGYVKIRTPQSDISLSIIIIRISHHISHSDFFNCFCSIIFSLFLHFFLSAVCRYRSCPEDTYRTPSDTCCKVMEQHEKTPHKDLEIFVQRERIVKPSGNLPPPETKFNNLKTNLLHTTTGFLTSRKGHALIFVSSPCCFCRRML